MKQLLTHIKRQEYWLEDIDHEEIYQRMSDTETFDECADKLYDDYVNNCLDLLGLI